jgi:hypothetical protein
MARFCGIKKSNTVTVKIGDTPAASANFVRCAFVRLPLRLCSASNDCNFV